MVNVETIRTRFEDFVSRVSNWLYAKAFQSVNIPENLEFIYDVAVARKRYLTVLAISFTSLLYRLESFILGLFRRKG